MNQIVGNMDSDAKVYRLEDVSKHNTHEDCWLVIGEKVYDVSKFLEDHPGGDEVLLSATGIVPLLKPTVLECYFLLKREAYL